MYCLYNVFYIINKKLFFSFYSFKNLKLVFFNNFNIKLYVNIDYSFYYKIVYKLLFNFKKIKVNNSVLSLNKINFINKLYFNFFLKILNFFLYKNFNIVFIDVNYNYYLPLYNYTYGLNNVYKNKSFFFFKKSDIFKGNWVFFYNSFLKKERISLIVFLDYKNFFNIFKFFLKFNKPLFSVLPFNKNSIYLDFYFYINYNYSFYKIIILNLVYSIFFKNKLKFFLNKKIKYLNSFIV